MKYLLLICWDAERMDAQTEPDRTEPLVEDSFPWLDDIRERGSRSPATGSPHRAGRAPSASAKGR